MLQLTSLLVRLAVAGCLGLVLLIAGVPSAALAASFTVNATSDAVDADPGDGRCRTAAGTCTLRAAVMETNALEGADTVTLPAGSYGLSLGDLVISDALTVTGAGAASTTIIGRSRVPGSLRLREVTLTGGFTETDGGALFIRGSATLVGVAVVGNWAWGAGSGIAVDSTGWLQMLGGSIANNRLIDENTGAGGALANYGTVRLQGVAVTGNQGGFYGPAGIFNDRGASLSLVGGRVADNDSPAEHIGGAGIFNQGRLTISNTRLVRNRAWRAEEIGGGAILNGGSLTATNALFDANFALSGGGGIYNLGTISLRRVTFTNNTSSSGRLGFRNGGAGLSNGGKATLRDVVVRGNVVLGEPEDEGGVDGAGIDHFVGPADLFGFLPPPAYLDAAKVTLAANTTNGKGGGLWSGAPFVLVNVTIANNRAASGSGVANRAPGGLGQLVNVTVARNVARAGGASIVTETPLTLSNTIVAKQWDTPGTNCAGPIRSVGGNLASDHSCNPTSGDQSGVSPRLASALVTSNGSYTPVLLLAAGSPAIDRGVGPGCPAQDQRNLDRPLDGDGDGRAICDTGAVERRP